MRSAPGVLPQGRAELSDAALVSRSWGMAFATLVSRITGFARIVLLAAILGAALASAFSVANQLPNLVAALVLEATFTAIFVPVLARAEQDDPDGGAAFVRRLVTLATTVLVFATVLSVTAAPLLVRLMLGHDPQVNEPLTTAFAYLLLPQVIFYGLSSVFMAILNTRNVFGPPAWAPVVNNLVAIATLGVYLAVPGQLSVDPVRMGNAKLLVLGIGTTLGVFAQTAVLLVAILRQRISLRPLWGIDQRLKRFGAMAAAMVLYVLISQLGLVVGNQIASTAAASGPAIYNYTWLVLMLPFGMIGVTVLTVVMPRLSRNAAADDIPAVLADLSLATRLTMITLIPTVAFMTVGGPAIGSALFAYGRFGDVDASHLGAAITLSAFTLIPYALVLLQLRVFYAREEPWTPIAIIVVITTVKVVASLLAPYMTDNRELVAAYLGLANGLGFVAGAIVGYFLLRRTLRPLGGHLVGAGEVRTILVTVAASLLAGLIAYVTDWLLGLAALTAHAGSAGSLLRLFALAVLMLPIVAGVMVRAQVPEAQAAFAAVVRRVGGKHVMPVKPAGRASDRRPHRRAVTYAEQRNSFTPGGFPVAEPNRRGVVDDMAGAGRRKGSEVTDRPAERASTSSAPEAESAPPVGANGPGVRPAASASADEFQPDIPADLDVEAPRAANRANGHLARDLPKNAVSEPLAVDAPREPRPEPARRHEVVHLVPGARIADGRYRLLVFHGGAPPLQFWQALDTALNRQVALTFVDPDGALPEDQLHAILSRTMRLSRISRPGIARVLDVVHTGTGGLVVAEWVRGGSLQEVADTSPSPVGAARAMQSLAAAAEAAHQVGVALSVDHPSRVRVSITGDVVLAFPATMPDATPEADIRGIGAALYALLVNRWPLPEAGVRSGLAPADRNSLGHPVEPSLIDPEIPFQISAAAVHAVQEGGGIRSASTLLNLLQQATAVADRTDLLSPVKESPPPPDAPSPFGLPSTVTDEVAARHRRILIGGIGAAVAVIAVVLLLLASVLSRIFGDVGGGLDKDRLGLNAPTSATTSATGSAVAGSTVKPVKATVFSPGGDPDSPGQAGLAIDGNPATAWSTDTYHDAVPFPSFKSGVGLLLQLPTPTVVGNVTIDISSTGTKVQLRSSPTPTPAKLEDTAVLTPPTPLQPGHNSIPVKAASPTSNLLVWISTLGTTAGKSRADISEITVQAAP
ncbi:murein biosynthesis protein MurJ [Mycobacterium heckeshornense]|uniref:murein biosynthesis integral membrane protein MurJ n=1 Tax=Mycobacterium heckeshornense TaxID=110505 RepID=UPI000662AD0D|nr:murein biosynthesis integral membrane protein MurJ [Mycobacterium heckeshornense]KMV22692.1 membrane protein [Mycobacterium heckeshornense]MCV7034315.1 murein biosynthesis protein MurJ [Mycobacterium heckeshornense]PIJ32442.1 murein biosynthesis protein MurJ [Mycobacterium heckeshornense]